MVVLPAPFGPSNANTLPCGTAILTSFSTVCLPNDLVRPDADIAGEAAILFDIHAKEPGNLVLPTHQYLRFTNRVIDLRSLMAIVLQCVILEGTVR